MAIIVDRSEQVSGADLNDGISSVMYVAQTFVAGGKALEEVAFFINDIGVNPLAYRLLVTTVENNVNGFHPGTVLFESGRMTGSGSGATHKVVVDVGGVALALGTTYAFILETATDTDGLPSSGRFALSYDGHHGLGDNYADGFEATLSSNPGFTRAGHFAADWNERTGPSSAADLAFILTFSNPGVTIEGTKKNDRVDAEHGVKGQKPTDDDDTILGKKGEDRIDALGGDDLIDGGKAKDKLTGGSGEDSFVFSVSLKQKPDKIMDFVSADDTIVLTGKAFGKLDPGALSDAAFRDVGETASEADRIIYKANGTLAFDKDGKGGADAEVFAKLVGAPDIAAVDIVVA